MECLKSSRTISTIIDACESEQDLREMTEHIEECETCSEAVDDVRRLRRGLRNLPRQKPSAGLETTLRRVAYRDRARRLARLKLVQTIATWRLRIELMFRDMMQPMALPVAGGIVSALMLFAMLAPGVAVGVQPINNDVPTVLFTNASVKDVFWPVIGDADIVVDVDVDESGRLTDYSIVSGAPLLRDEGMRRRFESALLLSQFTPATSFGTPMSGRIRVSFRTSRIDIKG